MPQLYGSSRQPSDTLISANSPHKMRLYFVLAALVFLLLCWPIWFVEYVPLVDYPNHLARANILYEYAGNPTYQATYNESFKPLPNLAMDLLVPFFMNFVEINIAGKVFLTLGLLLFCIGCHALARAIHGRPSWLAIPIFFFFYNSMLFYGFVNYMFGCGMFMITLAWWLKHHQAWKVHAWIVAAVLILASYLSHLSSYLFLCTAVVVFTFADYASTRRIGKQAYLGLLTLVLPTILFLLYFSGAGETKYLSWNGFFKKVIALASPFLSYNFRLDLLFMVLVGCVLGVVYYYARAVKLARKVILTAGALGLLFVLCPEGLFQVNGADARFVLPAVVLLVLSVSFKMTQWAARLSFALILIIFATRLFSMFQAWTAMDHEIRKQVAMFNSLPQNSNVYPIIFLPQDIRARKVERSYMHVIHYSTIYRHTFSPSLFAIKGQQPITLKNEAVYFHEYHDQQPQPEQVDWKAIFDNYNYIWCYNIDDRYDRWLRDETELVSDGGRYKIFRIPRK